MDGASVHPDAVEMKSKNKMDITQVAIENKGYVPDETDNEAPKPKPEIQENVFEEGGVVYDDADWQGKANSLIDAEAPPTMYSFIGTGVRGVQRGFVVGWKMANHYTKGHLLMLILVLLYIAYFIAAMINEQLEDENSIRLLVFTIIYILVKTRFYWIKAVETIYTKLKNKSEKRMMQFRIATRWLLYLVLLAMVIWVVADQGYRDTRNLRALPGVFVVLIACLLMSENPYHINWNTVVWGMGLQFILAILILKLSVGRDAVLWAQDRFDEYFANTDIAAEKLFGKSFRDHYLVFGAFPLIIFSNATVCVLYYVGAMQIVINFIGSILRFVLGTSRVESLVVAASIFLEGAMTLLSIKPFLGRMTRSQLFLVITAVLSSLGGTYLGVLTAYKVRISDIIPAMMLSAPATFVVCKMMMPEVTKTKNVDVDEASDAIKSTLGNGLLEVAQIGAVSVLSVIGTIIAVLYMFYSLLSWVDETLIWLGDRVGWENVTLELIFSYLLYPVAVLLGIEIEDCRRVGILLGYRIASSNLVAFKELASMNVNRNKFNAFMNATDSLGYYETKRDDIILNHGQVVLKNGFINDRSERIITNVLCGFSSIASVGLHMGILANLVPRRRAWANRIFLMALLAGNLSNCLTGAFACLFYFN